MSWLGRCDIGSRWRVRGAPNFGFFPRSFADSAIQLTHHPGSV